MYLGELIKNYRERENITMAEFAAKCRLSKGYISMLEKNKHPQNDKEIVPSVETLSKVAGVFGIPLNELLSILNEDQPVDISHSEEENEHKIKGVRIPVLGYVRAGIPVDAVEEILDWEEINPSMAAAGDFFALRIKGDSMEPKISEGDVVIVKEQPDVESGDVAIVLVNGDDATVKRLIKYENGSIALVAFNSAYQPMIFTPEQIESLPVRVLGKVVELRAKF